MKISLLFIYYLLAVFGTFIMLKIYSKFTNKHLIYNKKHILLILGISMLTFANNIFVPVKIRGFSADLLFIILTKTIFKDKIKTNLYYSLIILVTLQVFDLLTAFFLPLSIKNVEALNQSIYFKVIITIVVNFLLYFALANRYVVNFINQFKNTSKNNKIFYALSSIGLILFTYWSCYSAINLADKTLNVILCITEVVIVILLILTLKNIHEKNISKIKEEQLKQNLNFYANVANEYKEIKHNLMNDLLIIKSKFPKKDQTFINDIINKYKTNYDWVNSVDSIPEGLQGLVFIKKSEAEKHKILFNLEYKVDKNIEDMFDINNNFKLYEALGILFDNAIEAASETKEKLINVVFTYENKTLNINILNTFCNELDLDKYGEKNYSTKKRGSGIGVNYLKRQKNSKFTIQQSIRENIFISEIVIKHNKKSSNK